MEFWNGWFDHWGEGHHVRPVKEITQELETILSSGASVNFYMAHGGTNFGLFSGANLADGRLQPTVTSYDYDAPIGEAGELTEKFHAYRDVISRYAAVPREPLPEPLPRQAPQRAEVTGWAGLLEVLDSLARPVSAPYPLTMEQLGQNHGLVHYRRDVTVPRRGAELYLDGLHDRATVIVNGSVLDSFDAQEAERGIPMRHSAEPVRVDIIVENQGRVNYGPRLGEHKGITGVRLGQRYLMGWESRSLPLDRAGFVDHIEFSDRNASAGGVFARVECDIEEAADGFIALPGWGKGFVWLNGFLLGRYWNIGPQLSLYAPAPLWKDGANEVIVLELEHPGDLVQIMDEPQLGRTVDVRE
jgi:beta-galactosidase